MRGLEKSCMGKGHANGHRDSMKESAKGRFFEKKWILLQTNILPKVLEKTISLKKILLLTSFFFEKRQFLLFFSIVGA